MLRFLNCRFSDTLIYVCLLRDIRYSCFSFPLPMTFPVADFPLSCRRKCVCHKSTPAPFA